MKEELEAEAKRLRDLITKYDEQHKGAAYMANVYRKQLKVVERDYANLPVEQTQAEAAQEISE